MSAFACPRCGQFVGKDPHGSGYCIPKPRCAHNFTYRDIDGRTWNVCVHCGFGERWEGGMLCESTDMNESNRLDGWRLASENVDE